MGSAAQIAPFNHDILAPLLCSTEWKRPLPTCQRYPVGSQCQAVPNHCTQFKNGVVGGNVFGEIHRESHCPVCREKLEREASPMASIVDRETRQKRCNPSASLRRGHGLIATALRGQPFDRLRRSKARSAIFLSTRSGCFGMASSRPPAFRIVTAASAVVDLVRDVSVPRKTFCRQRLIAAASPRQAHIRNIVPVFCGMSG
jgi:hypothetical protein